MRPYLIPQCSNTGYDTLPANAGRPGRTIPSLLIVARPTIGSLALRRLLMPFSSTPWHSGEAAALADLFRGDPAAYGHAKSRIELVQYAAPPPPPPPPPPPTLG
eukprot:SAG11_NODE_7012_length_1208_cov_56.130748_4_plen_103_part_01